MPKIAVMRSFVMNHIIHTAATLGYLRLNDIPVPSIYGPSADEADVVRSPNTDRGRSYGRDFLLL